VEIVLQSKTRLDLWHIVKIIIQSNSTCNWYECLSVVIHLANCSWS